MSKTETNDCRFEWSPENEIHLFYAMRGHKPTGISRNFQMVSILDSLVNSTSKDISSKVIWDHLDELYDMETLHENESTPFLNEVTEFTIEGIPEFDEIIAKRFEKESVKPDKDNESQEQNETTTPVTKPAVKSSAHSKTQETNKTNTKAKATDNEKNTKVERKEETTKHEKNDEIEEKSIRSKKQQPKASSETRSASHNTPSSAKKRK